MTTSSWKSERPVAAVHVSMKFLLEFVKNRSMQVGFLKHIGFLFRDFNLYWLQNEFKFISLTFTNIEITCEFFVSFKTDILNFL